jgi:hypothetical protein
MEHEGACCGGNLFADLDPARQAEYLALLARDARLLEFSLEEENAESRRIAAGLQHALERALDAESADDARGARDELEVVLAGARGAGLRLSATLTEMDVDGVVGSMRMRVLSTVLGRPAVVAS